METFPMLLALCAGNSPVNSPHKGQWHGALMFSLICAWINGWVNNHEAGDLRCHHAHYDIIVMLYWGSRCIFHTICWGAAPEPSNYNKWSVDPGSFMEIWKSVISGNCFTKCGMQTNISKCGFLLILKLTCWGPIMHLDASMKIFVEA